MTRRPLLFARLCLCNREPLAAASFDALLRRPVHRQPILPAKSEELSRRSRRHCIHCQPLGAPSPLSAHPPGKARCPLLKLKMTFSKQVLASHQHMLNLFLLGTRRLHTEAVHLSFHLRKALRLLICLTRTDSGATWPLPVHLHLLLQLLLFLLKVRPLLLEIRLKLLCVFHVYSCCGNCTSAASADAGLAHVLLYTDGLCRALLAMLPSADSASICCTMS